MNVFDFLIMYKLVTNYLVFHQTNHLFCAGEKWKTTELQIIPKQENIPPFNSKVITDIEVGVKSVEYFIRTGEFYPRIDWLNEFW